MAFHHDINYAPDEKLPVAIACSDRLGHFTFKNSYFKQLLPQDNLFAHFTEHEQKSLFSVIEKALEQPVLTFTYNYEKDASQFVLDITADNQQQLYLSSINQTLLQQLNNEIAEYQMNLQRLEAAIKGANIGCWDFYPKQGKIIANHTWVSQKLYPDEAFRQSNALFSEIINGLDKWKNLVHPDDLESTINIIQAHLDGKTHTYDATFRMRFGDDKWHWIRDIGQVSERDEHGHAIRMNGVHIDITQEKELELKVAELVKHDDLTGLMNRHDFEKHFDTVVNETSRTDKLTAFLIIDIDHFKEFNDTYGHQEGDRALITIGTLMRSLFKRHNDACFRLGGEEFGIIYNANDKACAIEQALQLKQAIEALNIPHINNSASPYLTVSMGLYCRESLDDTRLNEIYSAADKFLYSAKRAGRNNLVTSKGIITSD